MSSEQRLADIAASLDAGQAPPLITVREFLSWFGAMRRGYWIVLGVRQGLEKAGLRTEPDFESAYIDSHVRIVRDKQAAQKAVSADLEPTQETTTVTVSDAAVVVTGQAFADPTYRISKLEAANRRPFAVPPDASLQQVVTEMIANDFSQVPVLTSERDVKGCVSWSSIGTRLALGKPATSARDVMDPHSEVPSDASLFQAIPIIVQHDYVLVRGPDKKITGIVTASDLSLQFQQLAEPFLLLGEIENHVRRLIGSRFPVNHLQDARDPADTREIRTVADLTFGGYVRLLEKPERWAQLGLAVDRGAFIEKLDEIREIRNDVMHFDPDPIEGLDSLRDFARFLRRLQALGVT